MYKVCFVYNLCTIRFSCTQIAVSEISDAAICDCFDSAVLGISIGANMQASLCVDMLDKAIMTSPDIKGAIVHSDISSQYTSQIYRDIIAKCNVIQSMNSDGGCCHDNARCESMWARMKS